MARHKVDPVSIGERSELYRTSPLSEWVVPRKHDDKLLLAKIRDVT
jgi:hypothetical protein